MEFLLIFFSFFRSDARAVGQIWSAICHFHGPPFPLIPHPCALQLRTGRCFRSAWWRRWAQTLQPEDGGTTLFRRVVTTHPAIQNYIPGAWTF